MFLSKLITKGQHQTSLWSGGTTTQLAIYPAQAVYSDRNFIWRLSSAVVEDETSTFTSLPDYNRIIAIVQGELGLCHNGGPAIILLPLEQNTFDGASHTVSTGKVTDFNLMMKKGQCYGEVEVLELAGKSSCTLRHTSRLLCFPCYTQALYCCCGRVELTAYLPHAQEFTLTAGDLLLLSTEQEESLKIAVSATEDAAIFISKISHK